MRAVDALVLKSDEAALWTLGQAGCLVRSAGVTVAIDPYLSDSVAKNAPDCTRLLPVPIRPEALRVDLFVVTHDHLDHLDPETVGPYRHKDRTLFVAPRLACVKLAALGVPARNIRRLDVCESATVCGVTVRGMVALPTEKAVEDTTGYRLEFPNGRSLYHSSDTGFSEDLLRQAVFAEVLLVCINGKWGNPVLWHRRFFARMSGVSGDVGARHLIGDNEESLLEIAMDDDAVLADLDTPEALAAHKAARKN